MSDTQQYWANARRRFSGEWAVMTFYERFEQIVALHTSLATGKSHYEP